MDEARRRREHDAVIRDLGVYNADWALYKDIEWSDIQPGQNRLLLTKTKVQYGPLPKLFPEVEQLGDNGQNAQAEVDVTILNAEGVEKAAVLRYLNSNSAYRIKGPGWGQFVEENGLCRGDRLDIYTCKRGEGERCLLFFKSESGGSGGSPRARAPRNGASNGRRRSHRRAAVGDTVADGVGSGDADRGSGKLRRSRDDRGDHRRDANGAAWDSLRWANTGDTGRRRGDRKRARNTAVKEEESGDHADQHTDQSGRGVWFASNASVHACTGDFHNGRNRVARSSSSTHECCKAETTSEEESHRWWVNATDIEKDAARGLMRLKWAAIAEGNQDSFLSVRRVHGYL